MTEENMEQTPNTAEQKPAPQSPASEELSFADMLEASEAGGQSALKVGDKIRGPIIAVTKDAVFIDAGAKIDGVADKEELLDSEGEFPHQVGDELELYVVKLAGGELRLSKAVSGEGGLVMIEEAYQSAMPVQGKITGTCKGGYNVKVMGRRAFCPISQIDSQYVEDPEIHVGQEYAFQVITFEEKGRNVVLSRRKLLEAEQQEAAQQFQQDMQPGDVVQGKITRIKPFGVFVELVPGVEGMVHVSELGWSRVAQPQDVVSEGETLSVKVLSMEPDPKRKGLRIALSAKQAQADPWDEAAGKFAPGDVVQGTVIRLAPFGAFVELVPGVEGLVHISELSYTRRVLKPEEVVNPGDVVQVLVKDVDVEQRRIGLSLREAQGDPWSTAGERYAPGSVVTGTLEKREQFGLFVNLEPGVTGLLPKSLLAKAQDPAALESLKPGEQMQVRVEALDTEARKATLAPAEVKEDESMDWRKEMAASKAENAPSQAGPAASGSNAGSSSGGGGLSLGDKLQDALARKNKS